MYNKLNISSPIDPVLYDWVHIIPEGIQERPGLMDFIMRVAHHIYEGNGFERKSGINPFYKMIEFLRHERLSFETLLQIKEYYHFDIIEYLTEGNRGEYYLGYPCPNSDELRKILSSKKNTTDSNTLADILSNIV